MIEDAAERGCNHASAQKAQSLEMPWGHPEVRISQPLPEISV